MNFASSDLFKSFFIGGFECSTHRRLDGLRLDMVAATQHDKFVFQDYRRLSEINILAAREGIRWHLIEKIQGYYDFSSVLPFITASRKIGTQIIWDVCHYGWPDDLDIFSSEFIDRFARFAKAFARFLNNESDETPFICPINEISFFSYASAEKGFFHPFAKNAGKKLKAQLVRAAIEGIEAVWDVNPKTRIIHTDPIINVLADPLRLSDETIAESYRLSQYQAWDALAGRVWPELGGNKKYLDIVGLNYYPHNQWILSGNPTDPGIMIERNDPLYRPFRELLKEVYMRYRRPMFIAETGIEDEERPFWLRYVADEVRAAIQEGVRLEGICLYPIVNHPGWADERHCHNGLWDYACETGEREICDPLAEELKMQQRNFEFEFSHSNRQPV